MVEEAGTANLEKVDHIVVLMLENRSFDHMLGYLSLEGGRSDVDGLREGLANEHQGRRYPVHHLGTTVIAEDPDHSASSVDLQIGGGKMDGFVASYAATMESRGVEDGDPAPIMGYYHAADVPVYDHLASEFAACDRWFSSVPGATWPNRLYALCGRAAGSRDCHPHNLPPLYNQPSFVRHLDEHGVSWRWYSSDVGTLRMADQLYCLGHHDRFAYFTKTGLPWKAKLNLRVQSEDAAFWKTPPAVRCRRSRGSTRTGATSTHSASSKTMTTRPRTSGTAKTLFWRSTTRWRRARSGTKRSWSSSTTSTAASSIMFRRPKPTTTTRRRSAATACGCRR